VSIWGSLGGDEEIYAADPDYQPSGEQYVVDVAVALSYNDYTRLGIWTNLANWEAGQPALDVTVCLDRENVRRLIDRLEQAISSPASSPYSPGSSPRSAGSEVCAPRA